VTHRPDPRSGRSHPRPKARTRQAGPDDATQLSDAVTTVMNALPDIRDLLTEPTNAGPQTGTIGRHAPESSEPWHGEAAAVYWTIHFGARQLEDSMRADIGLPPVRPERGGTEANTIGALIQINRMGSTVTEGILTVATRRVERWVHAIERLGDMDQAEQWVPVPRAPGTHIFCPFCQLLTLRVNLRREVVRCFNPPCRDSNDRPPVATITRGRMSGLTQLVFQDGREVDYKELAENPEETEPA
jgi:hypothetical protein